MLILGIDTSGHTASAAVCDGENILAESFVMTKLTQSQIILPLVQRVLSDCGHEINDIEAIAAVKGPGSYTGIRIGISAAKGISTGNGCKCAGISSLEALAYNFSEIDCEVSAVMLARKNLLYNANFRVNSHSVERLSADRIISEEELILEISETGKKFYAAGDYAQTLSEKSENIMKAPAGLLYPRASSVCFAALRGEFVSADELSPDYLQITKAEKDLKSGTPGE